MLHCITFTIGILITKLIYFRDHLMNYYNVNEALYSLEMFLLHFVDHHN